MTEFTVGTSTYRSDAMSAFQQFHLARKLAPVIAPFIETALPFASRAAGGTITKEALPALLKDISPVLKILSDLPEAEVEYVLGMCLGTVSRKDPKGGGWAPIWSEGAKRMMFADIAMPEMLVIAAQVIQANLADFIKAPLPTSSAA